MTMTILFIAVLFYTIYEGATRNKRRETRLRQAGISEIDCMSGQTFEHYLASIFKMHGYQVIIIKPRHNLPF